MPEGDNDPKTKNALRSFIKHHPRHSTGTLVVEKSGNETALHFNSQDSKAQTRKNAFISFVDTLPWSLFGTVGIDFCPEDEEAIRRLRLIEARLNKKYVCVAYHKLAPEDRFSMIAAFEGDRKSGDRHLHFLLYCPVPRKKAFSREMLISSLFLEMKILWNYCSRSRSSGAAPDLSPSLFWNGYEWDERKGEPLKLVRCGAGGADYTMKRAPLEEADLLQWHFITPPKYNAFENENLIVTNNRDRQKRRSLGKKDRRRHRPRHIVKTK